MFYYSDYNLHGGEKIHIAIPWACCAGTRSQTAAGLADLVYLKDSIDNEVEVGVLREKNPESVGRFAKIAAFEEVGREP